MNKAEDMSRNITIRTEAPADAAALQEVNEPAFCRTQEADLVDRLRASLPMSNEQSYGFRPAPHT
jgi:predicted N-acetyltransferase YhbS